jgi:hypothetical protein
MDNGPDRQPDDIEEFLRPPIVPSAGDPLRPALLLQTMLRLRGQRRRKRLTVVAAMAACYLAGILTMRLGMPAAEASDPERAEKPADKKKKDVILPSQPAPDRGPNPERPTTVVVSALELEWQAIDSKDKRAELYRRAGDRYLEESNDVESALRCYRGYLAAGSDRDGAISVRDNWVLMVAKQEHLKEKDDANNGS